jgi:steroid Delta-isomerase
MAPFHASPGSKPHSAELTRVIDFFENIAPDAVTRIGTLYSADCFFKDPFNEVRGIAELERIFGHMFVQLNQPRFTVTMAMQQDSEAFLLWDFHFRMKQFDRATTHVIRGSTHLRFDAHGMVHWHRDYWDAAEELYEKLPLVGTLMRWLKRQAG